MVGQGIRIESCGIGLSVQDGGRKGLRRFGVPTSGVMDSELAKFANLMVSNFGEEPLIEFAYGGVKLVALSNVWIAVAGAGMLRGFLLRKGESLNIPWAGDSVWGYVAVRGGWNIGEVLGSRSYYARSDLGVKLKDGIELWSDAKVDNVISRFVRVEEISSLSRDGIVRVTMGPHASQFSKIDNLVERRWTISKVIDRTGYRLDGVLEEHELSVPSFPVVPGCVQVTPGGQMIVTMPDGPTVGGYPVVAVVHPEDLAKVAQRVPGSEMKFEWYDFS